MLVAPEDGDMGSRGPLTPGPDLHPGSHAPSREQEPQTVQGLEERVKKMWQRNPRVLTHSLRGPQPQTSSPRPDLPARPASGFCRHCLGQLTRGAVPPPSRMAPPLRLRSRPTLWRRCEPGEQAWGARRSRSKLPGRLPAPPLHSAQAQTSCCAQRLVLCPAPQSAVHDVPGRRRLTPPSPCPSRRGLSRALTPGRPPY